MGLFLLWNRILVFKIHFHIHGMRILYTNIWNKIIGWSHTFFQSLLKISLLICGLGFSIIHKKHLSRATQKRFESARFLGSNYIRNHCKGHRNKYCSSAYWQESFVLCSVLDICTWQCNGIHPVAFNRSYKHILFV